MTEAQRERAWKEEQTPWFKHFFSSMIPRILATPFDTFPFPRKPLRRIECRYVAVTLLLYYYM